MAVLRAPSRPGINASDQEIARYQDDLRDYRVAVQNVALEIESLCREVFNLCEELGNEPMAVMDSVSTNIWAGQAAMQFQFDGGTRKQKVADVADEYRETVLSIMKQTNDKLASL